jgi:hypothetical protein
MNNHDAPAEGISSDEQGYAKTPLILEVYNRVCHVDMGGGMANSYCIGYRA